MFLRFRAALVSLLGFCLLAAGFLGGGRRGGDLAWFLLLFVLCQIGAVVLHRRRHARDEKERVDALIAARREKMGERDDGRVTGKHCVVCERRIVIEHDGERCETCRGPVHLSCLREHRGAHTQATSAYR